MNLYNVYNETKNKMPLIIVYTKANTAADIEQSGSKAISFQKNDGGTQSTQREIEREREKKNN